MTANKTEVFKQHLFEAGVIDGQIYSEFDICLDGSKRSFGVIEPGSQLFDEWLRVNTIKVSELCTGQYFGRIALIGVANQTNDLVPLIAEHFGGGMKSLSTEKLNTGEIRLTDVTEKIIRLSRPTLRAIIINNIGVNGGITAPLAADVLKAGADRVEVINTWQKKETLVALDKLGVAYHAIFKGPI